MEDNKFYLRLWAMILFTLLSVIAIVATYWTLGRRDMIQNGYVLERPMVPGQETWVKKN